MKKAKTRNVNAKNFTVDGKLYHAVPLPPASGFTSTGRILRRAALYFWRRSTKVTRRTSR